jgi:hypothetical protein
MRNYADYADLQWPVSNPANAGIRDQFRLNICPPAAGHSAVCGTVM